VNLEALTVFIAEAKRATYVRSGERAAP